MHELSLAESMLELMTEQAEKDGFSKVTRVCLEVGRLSCVEPEAMLFCFESVMANTLASEAKLEIIPVPGVGKCSRCHALSDMDQLYSPCSYCGDFGLEILQGKRVNIKSLAVQ